MSNRILSRSKEEFERDDMYLDLFSRLNESLKDSSLTELVSMSEASEWVLDIYSELEEVSFKLKVKEEQVDQLLEELNGLYQSGCI